MRTATKRAPIGEILIAMGKLTREQLEQALEEQKISGKKVGEILLDLKIITPEDTVAALSQQMEIPHVWLRKGLVDPKIIDVIPQQQAEFYQVMPMFCVHNILTLATSNPQSVFVLDDLQKMTGLKIQPVLCRAEEIETSIEEYYGKKMEIDAFLSSLESSDVTLVEEGQIENIEEISEMAGESPVINLVNLIVLNAIKDGASDIHIEPDEDRLRVRYRVDGVMHEVMAQRLDLHPAVTSRLKIMANLDIAERRLPQEGRIRVTAEGHDVDLRFSSMPTVLGEKVVLRVLDKRAVLLDLDKLGFHSAVLPAFKSILRQPNGLILATGPTGSGKTTTLYAAVSLINTIEKNLITIEDPVEYRMSIVNQIQVNDKIGLTFSRVLRSVLRQDPDIVMVGEIRDRETAETAIQAALTGHLVLSTLHTNDSAGAMTRLLDMGIEPYLVSSAVRGVLAQRLIRTICPECQTTYFPSPELRKILGLGDGKSTRLAKGRGCEHCFDTGFKGRMGIHEILLVDEPMRNLVLKRASTDEMRQGRNSSPFPSLYEDGLEKVKKGLTTIEEVTRAIATE
ncbi:MAG: Flp pilus assembly complex ATPase component TadA [Candidatus Eisenbacteria sp.]|nr:Flp pilus assembly complex ATPase component TadA [Candidatus Eisenbacteria bacterium]